MARVEEDHEYDNGALLQLRRSPSGNPFHYWVIITAPDYLKKDVTREPSQVKLMFDEEAPARAAFHALKHLPSEIR